MPPYLDFSYLYVILTLINNPVVLLMEVSGIATVLEAGLTQNNRGQFPVFLFFDHLFNNLKMSKRTSKILSLILSFILIFQQSGFAQVAAELNIAGHLSAFRNSLVVDKFRPLHLRYLQYLPENNSFKLLLDKGNTANSTNPAIATNAAKDLLKYFFIGISLPNDTFWVNLRPDAEDNIIDDYLAKTDIGKIMLESDLQLKKDTAKATSPETPEGRDYWNKLYLKAGELFGSENITIPTLTRPWIVPDEIIIRETTDSAYIYKATLKVMLEQDYLKNDSTYNFKDERLKQLNEYSSQLIRELIIPKLTKEVNTSKRYAPLRQVYYSLILAQWFKARKQNKDNQYSRVINRKDLTNLTSKEDWSKTTYFQAYQKSFKDGEYNIQEPVYTPTGQVIRSYFSGGEMLSVAGSSMTIIPADIANLPISEHLVEVNYSTQDFAASSAVEIKNQAIQHSGIDGSVSSPSIPTADKKLKSLTELPRQDQDYFIEAGKLMDRLGVKKGQNVLEVGPGAGEVNAVEVAKRGAHYRGYSLSDQQFDRQEYVFGKYDMSTYGGSATVKKGEFSSSKNSSSKNIADRSQDFILILSGALSDPFPESDSKEALRVIKPGGKIVLGTEGIWAHEKTKAHDTINRVLNEPEWRDKVRLELVFEVGLELMFGDGQIETWQVIQDNNALADASSAVEEKRPATSSPAEPWESLIVGGLREFPITYYTDQSLHINLSDVVFNDFIDLDFDDIMREAMNLLDLTKGKDIILLGGTLEESEEVKKRCPLVKKFHIVNIDTDKIKEMARNVYNSFGLKLASERYTFYNEDICYLKGVIPDGSVALAVNSGTLAFLNTREAVDSIREMERILAPGGIGIIEDMVPLTWNEENRDLRKYLSKNVTLIAGRTREVFVFQKKEDLASLQVPGQKSGSPIDKTGGIDFRALPIVTQAMSNLRLSVSSVISLSQLNSINLNQEFQEIQKMIEAGVIPSTDRIKEYVQASCLKGNLDMQKVVSCIADILRQEEEGCVLSNPMLRDILVVLESNRSVEDLRAIFLPQLR